MFFSAELLSKRDSGFGLLWLAATLGSKSSFKKLPKQSIRTADIPHLCDQISRPPEPLALRLSSNLMIGVARVYKIKHEFFVADVNSCFALVRKTIQEIHTLGALTDAQLTMAHPTVRPDAVTLPNDPTIAVGLEFDTFDASWEDIAEFATQRRKSNNAYDDDDDEFTPRHNRMKVKGRSKASVVTLETGRGAGLHTLDENYDHLMSTSFDANASFGGIDPSSSQYGAALGSHTMEDKIFDNDDTVIDLGLASELGEEWGAKDEHTSGLNGPLMATHADDIDFDGGAGTMDFEMGMPLVVLNDNAAESPTTMMSKSSASARRRLMSDSDKENRAPDDIDHQPSDLFRGSQTPTHVPIEMKILAADVADNIPDNTAHQDQARHQPTRKPKRARTLMDETIELTDEELRSARDKYSERQSALRQETERKRAEKESIKAFEDMLWGAPIGLDVPALNNFWMKRYLVQVEARSGKVYLEDTDEPNFKRRKLAYIPTGRKEEQTESPDVSQPANENPNPFGSDFNFDYNQDMDAPIDMDGIAQLRSSEEPERGRNASRLPSGLAFDPEILNPSSGAQNSAVFPWDNAGTSSNGGTYHPLGSASGRVSLDKADTQIRLPRSSLSISAGGGASFVLPSSHTGSPSGLNFGVSPDRAGHDVDMDDFQFNVTEELPTGTAQDTQDTDMTVVTLEKTSYNFLEYCKVQLHTLPGNQTILNFDDVVPRASTKRVAAAALYHCLVLSTKNLISVRQEQPYESIVIEIK